MNSTINTATKGESPGKFGDRTGAFRDAKHNGFTASECAITGRARQALVMLLGAGTKGVTQAQALIEGNGWRLAASIHVLRTLGFLICTHRVYRANGSWYARYELLGHSDNQGEAA